MNFLVPPNDESARVPFNYIYCTVRPHRHFCCLQKVQLLFVARRAGRLLTKSDGRHADLTAIRNIGPVNSHTARFLAPVPLSHSEVCETPVRATKVILYYLIFFLSPYLHFSIVLRKHPRQGGYVLYNNFLRVVLTQLFNEIVLNHQ